VWSAAGAAAAGWDDAGIDAFAGGFAPHARERALRALHEAGYDARGAGAAMRRGGAWWAGERLENEWRSFSVEECLRFEHAVDAVGKRFGAVSRLMAVGEGAEEAVAAEEAAWRRMKEAAAARGAPPEDGAAAGPAGAGAAEGETAVVAGSSGEAEPATEGQGAAAAAQASSSSSSSSSAAAAAAAATARAAGAEPAPDRPKDPPHPVTASLAASSRREPTDLPRSMSAALPGRRTPAAAAAFFYAAWKRHPEYTYWKERRREAASASFFFHRSACEGCGNGGSIVCCDTCYRSFHPACAGEDGKDHAQDQADGPLAGSWLCPVCRAGLTTERQRRAAAGFVRSELARLAACGSAFEHFSTRERLSRVRDRAEALVCGGARGAEVGLAAGPAAEEMALWLRGRGGEERGRAAAAVWSRLGVRWAEYDEIPALAALTEYRSAGGSTGSGSSE